MKKLIFLLLLWTGVNYSQVGIRVFKDTERDSIGNMMGDFNSDSMKVFNVLHYGAVADGSTDNYAKILSIIALMPSGATLYFPAQDSSYVMTNGVEITKPIKILGQGSKSKIKVTSGTTLSPLFYMGGSDPNGTPYPNYAAGTEYNFKNNLTKGQVILTGMESTTGLVAGDEIFLALGKDTLDTGQNMLRMWNKVKTVNSSSSITLEIPIPEDVDSVFLRSPYYSWAADSHTVYKYTTLPDGFEVGNLSIEYDASVASDFVLGAIRAKNLNIHDIWINRPQTGAPIVVGETENATVKNIYITKGAGIQIYGSSVVKVENVFCEQLTGSGLVIETQNRGVTVDGFKMQYGSSNAGTQGIFAGGNSKNVHLKNFNFISDSVSQAILHLTGTTENDENSLITENFAFYGDTGAVKSFQLKQHKGILDYNGMILSKTKHYRKTIDITDGLSNEAFDLAKGIIKSFKVKINNRGVEGAGPSIITIKDKTTGYGTTLLDYDNTIDILPASETFGYVTGDVVSMIGSSYPMNDAANMKTIYIYTEGDVPDSCYLVVDIEYYYPEDDGVDGVSDSEIPLKLNKTNPEVYGGIKFRSNTTLVQDSTVAIGMLGGGFWMGDSTGNYSVINTENVTIGANAELITNGNMTAWTGDDPDSWNNISEDANNYITEVSGRAKIVSNGSLIQMSQNVCTVGEVYKYSIKIDTVTSGSLLLEGSIPDILLTSVGTHTGIFTAIGDGNFFITRGGNPTNIVFDDVSVTLLPRYALIDSIETLKDTVDYLLGIINEGNPTFTSMTVGTITSTNGRYATPNHPNRSLDSTLTRFDKSDTLNYVFGISDVADGSYSGSSAFTAVPITITMVRAVLRTTIDGTEDTAKCNIYFSTDISSGSPNTLWNTDKNVVDSTTGITYSSFDDATIPAYSWIWLRCNDEVGTVNQLNMTVFAKKD